MPQLHNFYIPSFSLFLSYFHFALLRLILRRFFIVSQFSYFNASNRFTLIDRHPFNVYFLIYQYNDLSPNVKISYCVTHLVPAAKTIHNVFMQAAPNSFLDMSDTF